LNEASKPRTTVYTGKLWFVLEWLVQGMGARMLKITFAASFLKTLTIKASGRQPGVFESFSGF
jgi:hypothetical protein